MCGIVGYIGYEQAAPLLLKGLEKLEYRGYDSAGIAVYDGSGLEIYKSKGRLKILSDMIEGGAKVKGTVGIGHTRWATHGEPSDINSHPQVSDSGRFAVVHNGIIENYMSLKEYLINHGVEFVSETDTEVIAQLFEYYYDGDMLDTMLKVLAKVEGSYAIGVISQEHPDELLAVRKDSPLIVGIGEGENFIASDIPAILSHTRDIYRLEDNEIVALKADSITVYNMEKEVVSKTPFHVDWDVSSAEKGGYEHFMFKEIMEQPEAIRKTISPRLKNGKIVLDDVSLSKEDLEKISKIVVLACGSAYHVGMNAKYILEKIARIPVEVDLASEFRYRDPIIDESVLVLVISQSGETADTLAALREAKRLGARVISIVNVVGSSIANDSDDVLYTWAGPEIAVATTKAYSTQLAVVYLLALYLGEKRNTITTDQLERYVKGLENLPNQIQEILEHQETIQYLASQYFNSRDIFFIGRNLDYSMSLEGSLKLKEISYIHSEAYAAGELKHGTISLIEPGTLVIALCTGASLHEKMISNIREVKARGATVIALTTTPIYIDPEHPNANPDHVIYLPDCGELCAPSLTVVPLQLLAYYVALLKGCDIDKPRNLAKCVTVE